MPYQFCSQKWNWRPDYDGSFTSLIHKLIGKQNCEAILKICLRQEQASSDDHHKSYSRSESPLLSQILDLDLHFNPNFIVWRDLSWQRIQKMVL